MYDLHYVNYVVDVRYGCAINAAMSDPKKPFQVRLDDLHLEILDELRRHEPDIPTRSGMLRLLVERADPRKQKDKRK